jgi:hypothetical protein
VPPLNSVDMAEVKRHGWIETLATERWYRNGASLAIEAGCAPDAVSCAAERSGAGAFVARPGLPSDSRHTIGLMTLDELIEEMQTRGWTWHADNQTFTHPDGMAAITVEEARRLVQPGAPSFRPNELGR